MRYDLNNAHMDIEPVYEDIIITFKDSKIVDPDHIKRIETDIIKVIEAAPEKWFILDFKRVQHLSSSFLGCLLKLHKTIIQSRGNLKLRNLNQEIFKIFKITNLHKIFNIETKK